MFRSGLNLVGVLVTGALLGSFLGKFIAIAFPQGRVRDLFSTDITAGLHPIQLDLRIVDLTFGCLFHFNMMSVVGILAAAFLFKSVLK
ncbi:MAG: DUF4321 domain-containing protein [Elusimicrobia bacterium]|nr:DUF4321 domain-containing protein [Elusimicrobiota bacterium]